MFGLWYPVIAFGILLSVRMSFSAHNERRQFSTLYRTNLEQMVEMLDEDVDPCDDFFQHACGYYDQTVAYADDDATPVHPMLYNHEDRMHFFEERHESFATLVGQLLSKLYSECRLLKRGVKEPIRLWPLMVQQVPSLAKGGDFHLGWPYLHHQWAELEMSGVQLNWAKLAADLTASGVATTFLHIFFAEGTVYIAPPEVAQNCGNLTQLRDVLLPLLNGRNAQIAEIIGHELLLFCRELHSAHIQKTDNVHDVAELLRDDMIGTYFQVFFGRLNFTAAEVREARKVVIDMPRIIAFLRVFRNTDVRIIYNYVLWRAFEDLKLVLDDCFSLTEEFEELLFSEYWQWNVFEQHFQRDVAMATYVFHTTRFWRLRKLVLMGSNWAAFLETKLERKDFNVPRLIHSYANDALAPHTLATVYEALEWRRGAFYTNLLQMRRLKRRATFTRPHPDVDDVDVNHPHYFLRQFLYFSILVAREPLFHYFATQGFDLWQDSRLLHSTDGFYTALDCLEQQAGRAVLDAADLSADVRMIFRTLSEDEVLRIFNFYRAFVASYRDYQFWLEGEFFSFAEDFVLQYFELDSQRILFYAVAQQHCGRNDALYWGLINRSFMNVPDFQEAFNCSAEAPMNPVIKCMISSCEDL